MLFKDKNKIAEYAEMVSAVDFNALKSTLRNVEQKQLVAIIGKMLYKSLDDTYTAASDESTLTDPQKKLLDRCRMVVGPYLAYFYAPKAEVQLSSAGLRRSETNTEKTPYQYQVKSFRDACLSEAQEQTELLLQFLEENKADYTEWVNDDSFKRYRSLFIKTGGEFNQYFSSQTPHTNYWAMRSKMVDVEEQHIRPLLGDDLYVSLKQQDQATDPVFSQKEATLLLHIKKAIANFTVAFSIPFLNVKIDANGLSVVAASARATSDQLSSRAGAASNDITLLMRSASDSGKDWMQSAKNYLDTNHSDFPLYNYVQPTQVNNGCASYRATFGLT